MCCHFSKKYLSSCLLCSHEYEIEFLITFLIALNLRALTMPSDVSNAFITNEVVPDAVDVAPQEGIKVNITRKSKKFKQNIILIACRTDHLSERRIRQSWR